VEEIEDNEGAPNEDNFEDDAKGNPKTENSKEESKESKEDKEQGSKQKKDDEELQDNTEEKDHDKDDKDENPNTPLDQADEIPKSEEKDSGLGEDDIIKDKKNDNLEDQEESGSGENEEVEENDNKEDKKENNLIGEIEQNNEDEIKDNRAEAGQTPSCLGEPLSSPPSLEWMCDQEEEDEFGETCFLRCKDDDQVPESSLVTVCTPDGWIPHTSRVTPPPSSSTLYYCSMLEMEVPQMCPCAVHQPSQRLAGSR
jgi:hypothetical protein